jgi:Queuine tRNA-ribosyltransferase
VSELLVLGCSATKRPDAQPLPALLRYDGPWYRDFRKHLRESAWPANLDVAILSAEHGLIGALSPIQNYDRRMTRGRAAELAPSLLPVVDAWDNRYDGIHLCLGGDYLPALPSRFVEDRAQVFRGPIGRKRQQLGTYLRGFESRGRGFLDVGTTGRLSYFLPDWDDLLDPAFDFKNDAFSGPKGEREERHCSLMMRPDRIADGILVSLAQTRSTKGPLRYVGGIDARTLRPLNLREHYGLCDDQVLFGDCGAFSYVHEDAPPITTDYAVSLYDLYGFDLAASIDHIPVMERVIAGKPVSLTPAERKARVRLTIDNAADFLNASKRRNVGFVPVGIIQGLKPKDFADSAVLYSELGYKRIALGGLVPLSDEAISQIVTAVSSALSSVRDRPKIHLFGVFRPKLQSLFKELGIASFDSATYFRKAWLRSGQNYLARDGQWYSAIRVPMTVDGRTRAQLLKSGKELAELEQLEAAALIALHTFGEDGTSLESTLNAIEAYDRCFARSSEDASTMRKLYARTLSDRPWEHCGCQICRATGIDVIIFRGSNRNKRRGAHNTAMLYEAVCSDLSGE